MTVLNDIHSRLNPTAVHEVVSPCSAEEVAAAVRGSASRQLPVAVCGGRHAMGGQQFAEGGLQLDMGRFDRVTGFDPARRLVTVQSGVQWPRLLAELQRLQPLAEQPLTFRQKQTGADRLSIGGALSANIHGRGLQYKPFVEDIEEFTIVDAAGEQHRCSRAENSQLFGLAIGGYGLFGVVCDVTLRLVPRRKLRRAVEITTLDTAVAGYQRLLNEGFEYGDFQFATDPTGPDFLHAGVLSAYQPVPDDVPVTHSPDELVEKQWEQLLSLAHTDRAKAFALYAEHYLATDGQIYWSDVHQLGVYVDGYHDRIAAPRQTLSSEMITEVYVPRNRLVDFMAACRDDFRKHHVDLVYGTIRAIRRDDETFLPWAREDYACVVFNLHVEHDATSVAKARRDFRRLIDRALERGGSFYLTYHRWATREQLLAAYPRFTEFLQVKRNLDPDERFASRWYCHWRDLLDAPAAESVASNARRMANLAVINDTG